MPEAYQPPYRITPAMLNLIEKVGESLGKLNALQAIPARSDLHHANRIKTIQGTLQIEGNTLSLEQVTAVLEGKRVLAQPRELQEVRNAFVAYEVMIDWSPYSKEDIFAAHALMMAGLVDESGCFRRGNVGVGNASGVSHVAPQSGRVDILMDQLLNWLRNTEEHPLVASSVFHYEFEFVHPFQDGNGRIGRMWQSLVLSNWNSVFLSLHLESMIRDYRDEYYQTLNNCNKCGESTAFIEFILTMIEQALLEVVQTEQGTTQEITPKTTQEKIVHYLKKEPAITRRGLAKKLGMSSDGVKYHLKKLKDKGLIRHIGPKKGGYWEIIVE